MKLKRLNDRRSTQLSIKCGYCNSILTTRQRTRTNVCRVESFWSLAARCCRDDVLPSPIFQAAPQYQYPKNLSLGLSDRGMTSPKYGVVGEIARLRQLTKNGR